MNTQQKLTHHPYNCIEFFNWTSSETGSWQMGEYNDPDGYWIYFYQITNAKNTLSFGWSKNFRDRRRCCPQLYDPSACMCVCVVYPYAVLDVQRCVPEKSIVLQDTGLFGIILEGRRAAALKDPDAIFSAHATGQTKGLVKDKWMLCEEWLTK